MAKEIPLTRGMVAIVDDDWYEMLSLVKWAASKRGYARRSSTYNGNNYCEPMHRVILDAPRSIAVDHINNNRLDNRRSNLRFSDAKGNNGNQSIRVGGTSKFKGVHFSPAKNRWIAQISRDGRRIHIGTFTSEDEAAIAYNLAALAHFGDFAKLNICSVTIRDMKGNKDA